MKFIKDINNLKQKFKRPVLTIGIFDGVHLAHQIIIKKAVRQAKLVKGTSMILTFSPHPLKIVQRYSQIPLISSLEHRIDLIKQLHVDVCLLLDFNKEFAKISAYNFVKHILVDAIGINYLIIGEGFRFGKDRSGYLPLLKRLSKKNGFKILRVKTVKINNQKVSSTRIRSFIQKGKIEKANKFLGRKFSIYGQVKEGSARGRILGYPTANIEPQQEIIPARGVYAVMVRLKRNFFPGVLNIGFRPTFSAKQETVPKVEVHIFNFRHKLYGKKLEVFFIRRIRAEKRFISQHALLKQIKKDELKAKRILKSQMKPHAHARGINYVFSYTTSGAESRYQKTSGLDHG